MIVYRETQRPRRGRKGKQAMQTITTRHEVSAKRILAKANGVERWFRRDYSINLDADHARAVRALARELGWCDCFKHSDTLEDGSTLWVMF